jgi:hypothetical protein
MGPVEETTMSRLKRTVAIRTVQTKKMNPANGVFFDKSFNKHTRAALQKAGYFPPVKGKSTYALMAYVDVFSHKDGNVRIVLKCNGEKNGRLMLQGWPTKTSEGTAPGVKTQKDMEWALDELAKTFGPSIVKTFKPYFS